MRFLISCLCFLHLANAQSTSKVFTLTGTVAGTPTGSVYLSYIDSGRHYIKDSSRLTKGRFSFTGYISSPTAASFEGAGVNGWVDHSQFTEFFLEPGKIEAAFSESNFKQGCITGSKSQQQYVAYRKQTDALDTKWAKVLTAFNDSGNGKDIAHNKAIADKGLPLYHAERTLLSRQFIQQHPQWPVSAWLLRSEMFRLPFDSLKIYFNRLAPAVQNGTEGYVVKEFIRKEESIAVGKPAPDFTQPDTNGRPVSLRTFRNQYVLLDIWASWCVPCREEHPYLRQAYARFRDKGFTILSLSMDEKMNRNTWLEAIRKDSLTWPQVCDFRAWTNTVVSDYNVLGKGIPASFLINPQGIIIAMNLRGTALEEELEKHLPNNSSISPTGKL